MKTKIAAKVKDKVWMNRANWANRTNSINDKWWSGSITAVGTREDMRQWRWAVEVHRAVLSTPGGPTLLQPRQWVRRVGYFWLETSLWVNQLWAGAEDTELTLRVSDLTPGPVSPNPMSCAASWPLCVWKWHQATLRERLWPRCSASQNRWLWGRRRRANQQLTYQLQSNY